MQSTGRTEMCSRGKVELSVQRTNLTIAIASAGVGLLAILLTLAQGGGTVGFVLGFVLLVNGIVRYRLAQRE